tara:strand:+ start:516 stop:1028 length:513 start_codon:yes stop_codon:yes gene_type:complete
MLCYYKVKNIAQFIKTLRTLTKINQMKINLKNGIDKLIFGMKQKDVTAIYGKPDRNYKDEDDNVIFAYNKLKIRITFYQEEDFKLGYMVASSPELELFGAKVIGKKITDVKKELTAKGISKFTQEEFDTFENYFNEENWIIFQTEFEEVVKFEIGAIINQKDEFDWKFKS